MTVKNSEKYFQEFEKILHIVHIHVWSGLRAPVGQRTCGRTGGRADGRTCGRTDGRRDSDIVLSRHDRKKVLKIFPRVRKNLT